MRIRQDVLSALALPLELRNGAIRRLRISGDWTFAKGLRPSIEVNGVNVLLAFLPSPKVLQKRSAAAAATATGAPVPDTAAGAADSNASGGSDGASAPPPANPSFTAAAFRQLLKRVRVDVTDVTVTLIDSTADDSANAQPSARSPRGALRRMSRVVRTTTAGFSVSRVTTEGPEQPVAAVGTGGDPFARSIDVDFDGMWWVPEEVRVAQGVMPAVLTAHEDTREWLVVQPLTTTVRAAWSHCTALFCAKSSLCARATCIQCKKYTAPRSLSCHVRSCMCAAVRQA